MGTEEKHIQRVGRRAQCLLLQGVKTSMEWSQLYGTSMSACRCTTPITSPSLAQAESLHRRDTAFWSDFMIFSFPRNSLNALVSPRNMAVMDPTASHSWIRSMSDCVA